MEKANQVNQSDLAVVFRNSKPRREGEYPSTWLLLAGGQALKVLVIRDAETRPTSFARKLPSSGEREQS